MKKLDADFKAALAALRSKIEKKPAYDLFAIALTLLIAVGSIAVLWGLWANRSRACIRTAPDWCLRSTCVEWKAGDCVAWERNRFVCDRCVERAP